VITIWPNHEVFDAWIATPERDELTAIMAATGLAKSTASQVRSGRAVPHARHLPALAELVGVDVTYLADHL
jgi:transcriptional regulator with XRE-family HTH domain